MQASSCKLGNHLLHIYLQIKLEVNTCKPLGRSVTANDHSPTTSCFILAFIHLIITVYSFAFSTGCFSIYTFLMSLMYLDHPHRGFGFPWEHHRIHHGLAWIPPSSALWYGTGWMYFSNFFFLTFGWMCSALVVTKNINKNK